MRFGEISGGFAGGTLGYNWQTGNFVLGVEADAAWADVGVRVGNPALAAVETRIRSMGTVRGRVGYAFDQVLDLRHRRLCVGRQPYRR